MTERETCFYRAMRKIEQEADKLVNNPHATEEDVRRYTRFARDILPKMDFRESFERERAANTLAYQEIAREAHELVYEHQSTHEPQSDGHNSFVAKLKAFFR